LLWWNGVKPSRAQNGKARGFTQLINWARIGPRTHARPRRQDAWIPWRRDPLDESSANRIGHVVTWGRVVTKVADDQAQTPVDRHKNFLRRHTAHPIVPCRMVLCCAPKWHKKVVRNFANNSVHMLHSRSSRSLPGYIYVGRLVVVNIRIDTTKIYFSFCKHILILLATRKVMKFSQTWAQDTLKCLAMQYATSRYMLVLLS
jgi:hypothetical protein